MCAFITPFIIDFVDAQSRSEEILKDHFFEFLLSILQRSRLLILIPFFMPSSQNSGISEFSSRESASIRIV